MERIGGAPTQPIDQQSDQSAITDTSLKQSLRPYQRAIIFTCAMAGFLGLAGVYLASIAPNFSELLSSVWRSAPREEQTPPAEKTIPSPLPPDALANIPAAFRTELLASSPPGNWGLSRHFNQPIDKLCDYLGSLGAGKFSAMHNPVADGQWICSSDVLPAGGKSASPNISSIFVWIRGTERKDVDLFRLKVNFTDPASSDAAKSLALDVLGKLHASLGWDMPIELTNAVRDVKEASFDHYGVSYQVTREWSSLPRLNIVIHSQDKSGILPADAFAISATDVVPHKRPTPGPAKLPKPSSVSQAKPSNGARTGTEPIENLMQ